MDDMDQRILKELEKNGRITHEELGRMLNISRPAIHQRVSKLEQAGVIMGYTARIDWCKAGQVLNALIFINAKTQDFNVLMRNIMSITISGLTIEECYRITGQWCLMIRIRAYNTDNITALHDELLKFAGVTETLTMLVLSKLDQTNNKEN